MTIKFEEIAKQLLSRAGVIKVNSVLNPTLWACLIVTPISWVAAWVFQETGAFALLIGTGLLPIVIFVLQTIYFSLREPSRLQSEEYQIQEKQLNILERKGIGQVHEPGQLVEMSGAEIKEIGGGENG